MNYYLFDYTSGRIEILTRQDLINLILMYKHIGLFVAGSNKAIFVSKSKAINLQDLWYKRKAYQQNRI